MSVKNQFEDLACWQKARQLCHILFELSRREPFVRDYKFVSQIQSSSGSGMDNMAEGFERGGNKELIQFLYIAKGSLGETRSQIYRAKDQNYLEDDDFEFALNLALTASNRSSLL